MADESAGKGAPMGGSPEGREKMRNLGPAASGDEIRTAIRDITGRDPEEIAISFKKLSPGGIRAGEGSWDGNIYKYRY